MANNTFMENGQADLELEMIAVQRNGGRLPAADENDSDSATNETPDADDD